MADNKKQKTGFFASVNNLVKRLFAPNGQKTGLEALQEEAIMTPGKVIMKNFFSNKMAIIGIVGFLSIFGFSFIGSALNPVDFVYSEPILKNIQPGTGYLNVPKELSNKDVVKISSGVSFSFAITADGDVYGWGSDQENVLSIPQEVLDADIVDIAAGDRHVIALGKNGKLYTWGYNNFNQGEVPVEISGALMLSNPVAVYAGEQYSAVLTDKGELFTWGAVLSTQIDIVPLEAQGRITSVAASQFNMVLLLDDGTVAVTGIRGSEVNNIPEELTDGSVNIEKVVMSLRTALAIDDQGKAYVWGSSDKKLLQMPDIGEKVVDISADKNTLFALGESGEIYGWGSNALGELNLPKNVNGKIVSIESDFFQNYAITEAGTIHAWGNKGFVLGTDEMGRDMYTRLMHGGKITLVVGVIAVLISTFLGLLVGMTAGFMGGKVDNFLMRIAEIISSVPFLPLVITLSAFISGEFTPQTRIFFIMIILGLIGWTGLARLVRAQILIEREKDFVLAARALGIKEVSIVIRHILPNVLNICIVNMTLMYASTMLTEAGLSFLGFGVAPPQPSWGNMLFSAQSSTVIEFYWWRWVLPAVAILIAALSVNLIGDALRDALDPKANEK